jgi:hypothetical protein
MNRTVHTSAMLDYNFRKKEVLEKTLAKDAEYRMPRPDLKSGELNKRFVITEGGQNVINKK